MKLQSLALSSAALVLVMALVGSQAWGAVDPPDIILSKVTIYSPQTGQTVQIEGAPGAITNVQVDHTYVKVRNVTRDEAENGGIPRWSSPQRTVNPDGSFTAYSGPDYNCGTGSGDLLALTATNNDWIDPNVVTKDIGYVPNAPDTAPPDLACANSGVTTQSFSSGTLYLGGPGGSIQDTSWPCYVQIVQLDGGPPGLRQTVSGSTDPWSCNCSGLSANELVLLVVSDTYGNRNYRVFEAKSYTYVSGDLPTGSYSYSDQVDAERTGYHPYAGNGVSLVYGEFVYHQPLLTIDGFFDFPISLTYRSRITKDANCGERWDWTLGAKFYQKLGNIQYWYPGNGRKETFTYNSTSGNFDPPPGIPVTISGSTPKTLRFMNAHELEFLSNGRLKQYRDKDGHSLDFIFDSGARPIRLKDSFGRLTTVAYYQHGRVGAILDWGGRVWQVKYEEYSENHYRLSSIVWPDATTRSFAYVVATSTLIKTITDEEGKKILTNVYDGSNRVITQKIPDEVQPPPQWNFNYSPAPSACNSDVTNTIRVTDPLGTQIDYTHSGSPYYALNRVRTCSNSSLRSEPPGYQWADVPDWWQKNITLNPSNLLPSYTKESWEENAQTRSYVEEWFDWDTGSPNADHRRYFCLLKHLVDKDVHGIKDDDKTLSIRESWRYQYHEGGGEYYGVKFHYPKGSWEYESGGNPVTDYRTTYTYYNPKAWQLQRIDYPTCTVLGGPGVQQIWESWVYYGTGSPWEGRIWKHTNTQGVVTEYTYGTYGNAANYLIKIAVDPTGVNLFQRFDYGNPYGWQSNIWDKADNETAVSFDEMGRITAKVEKNVQVSSQGAGCWQDLATEYAYDAVGRLISETSDYFDWNGNIIKPNLQRQIREYDALGRVIRTQTPLEEDVVMKYHTIEYKYDRVGNLTETYDYFADAGGGQNYTLTVYYYDEQGRRIGERFNPLEEPGAPYYNLTYYFGNGAVWKRYDGRDGSGYYGMEYSLDGWGRTIGTIYPTDIGYVPEESGYRELTLNHEGWTLQVSEYKDTSKTLELSRTRHEFDEGGRSWRTLAYDLTGGQVLDSKAAFTPGGMVDYGLDPWGNKTDEEYDTAGRLVQTSLLRGQNVFIEKRSITYDLIGNRESEATTSYNETEQGGSTAGPVRYSHFKHNAAGWLLQTALGGAVPPAWNHWEYRCYDSFGYLRREYDARNMVEPQDQPTVRVKQYDFGGHVTRSQTLLDGTETPYPYWQETVYEYDLAGRLVLYLAIGNVEQENASYSAGWDFANRVTSRVYNDGKSESFSYACCGLLSSMTRRNGMNYTYQYDRHKRLREVRYTGGGNRIWNGNVTKTTKIVYKYDSGESGWLHLPLGVETYSDTTMLTAVMRTYTSLGEIASDWVWDVEAGVVKSVNYSYSRTGERAETVEYPVDSPGPLSVTTVYNPGGMPRSATLRNGESGPWPLTQCLFHGTLGPRQILVYDPDLSNPPTSSNYLLMTGGFDSTYPVPTQRAWQKKVEGQWSEYEDFSQTWAFPQLWRIKKNEVKDGGFERRHWFTYGQNGQLVDETVNESDNQTSPGALYRHRVLTETQVGGLLNKRGFFRQETETLGKYIGGQWRAYQGTYDRTPRSGFAMLLSRHSDNTDPDLSRVDDFTLAGQDSIPTHYSQSYGTGEYGQGLVLRYGQNTEDGESQPGDEIVTGIFFAYVKPQGNPPQDFVRDVKINLYHDPFDRLCSMKRTIMPQGGQPSTEEYKWHYDGFGRKIWATGYFYRQGRYDFTLSFVNDTGGRALEIHPAGYCSNSDLPIRLVYASGDTPVYGLEGLYDSEFWCLSDWDGYISRMVTGTSYQELLSQEPEFLVSGGSAVKRLATQGHPGYALKEEYLEFVAPRLLCEPGMQYLATYEDLPTIMIGNHGGATVPHVPTCPCEKATRSGCGTQVQEILSDSMGYTCPENVYTALFFCAGSGRPSLETPSLPPAPPPPGRWLFRGTSKSPTWRPDPSKPTIFGGTGFRPSGTDRDLHRHVMGNEASAYVSTSTSIGVAEMYATEYYPDGRTVGYIYIICEESNIGQIDVNSEYQSKYGRPNPHFGDYEIAFPSPGIPGWWIYGAIQSDKTPSPKRTDPLWKNTTLIKNRKYSASSCVEADLATKHYRRLLFGIPPNTTWE